MVQAKDPEQVQKHVKKCFEGVKSLELQPPAQNRRWEAVGLNAPDGEREKLVAPVKLEGAVEDGQTVTSILNIHEI